MYFSINILISYVSAQPWGNYKKLCISKKILCNITKELRPPTPPPKRNKQVENLAEEEGGYINFLQLLCSYEIYLSVWCIAVTLCRICLREYYRNVKLIGIHLYKLALKKIVTIFRNFLQIFLLVVETSSRTNKRRLFFIDFFS